MLFTMCDCPWGPYCGDENNEQVLLFLVTLFFIYNQPFHSSNINENVSPEFIEVNVVGKRERERVSMVEFWNRIGLILDPTQLTTTAE